MEIFMTDSLLLQTRLREITVNLERAHLLCCDASWGCDRFVAPYSSIGLILEGEGTMRADSMEIHPSRGQLYLLPAKTTQSFFTDADHPYRKYYCHFEACCQGSELFDLLRLPLCVDAADFSTAVSLFQRMISASSEQDPLSCIKSGQSVLDLLVYYMECCPPGSIRLSHSDVDSPLSRAARFAENSLDQSVTVAKMAEIAGYHPAHFTKLFQQRMGISPVQFLIHKKTEAAIEQLTATSLPISSIAESLGFGSQFYFSNFFKKQTGMTPSEYRNAFSRPHA